MQVQKNTAFTLVELLITIAIIAIIATWAIPSYQEFIMASNRSDAKSALLNIQLEQEKWRASHVAYATINELGITKTTTNGHYTIVITQLSDNEEFLATATPVNSQINDRCGTFAINQLGAIYENYADQSCWGD
jgi:type IV pilus assembly protein PilE